MSFQVEQRLGIAIPDSLLFEASTIAKLAEELSKVEDIERKTVYRVGGAAHLPAFFFFHGDWTNGGFYLAELAKTLGSELSLVAVAPHGMKGERIPPSLENMALERLPEILAFQRQGPFRLGGHCVGGMVAFETARLLIASGYEVELVTMVDPIWTPGGKPWPTLPKRTEAANTHKQVLPNMKATPESWEQYGNALLSYAPSPLQVRMLVFSAVFDGRPWHQVSSRVTLVEAPGWGHYDLVTFRSPFFAAQVNQQLRSQEADQRDGAPVA
jgi:pimeloyl-ACP methyl ester carboxylesterase